MTSFWSVTKDFKIAIGHRLSKHKGLCHNPHGHNLKVSVEIATNKLDENDMVIDFKDLKKFINTILDQFDHTTILNSKDRDNITHFEKNKYRYAIISDCAEDPTAEVLCRYLYKEIVKQLFQYKSTHIQLRKIKIWESDDSCASYWEV